LITQLCLNFLRKLYYKSFKLINLTKKNTDKWTIDLSLLELPSNPSLSLFNIFFLDNTNYDIFLPFLGRIIFIGVIIGFFSYLYLANYLNTWKFFFLGFICVFGSIYIYQDFITIHIILFFLFILALLLFFQVIIESYNLERWTWIFTIFIFLIYLFIYLWWDVNNFLLVSARSLITYTQVSIQGHKLLYWYFRYNYLDPIYQNLNAFISHEYDSNGPTNPIFINIIIYLDRVLNCNLDIDF